jgi:uncharacterized radical SAM superfamily protein
LQEAGRVLSAGLTLLLVLVACSTLLLAVFSNSFAFMVAGAGIDNGAIKGEGRAVELISRHSPTAVVVVALMPLEHTPMEYVTPPTPEDVSRVILAARLAMPETPLLLGCARPKGNAKSRLDILAIDAGVNGIAYPSEEGFEHALAKGLKPQIHDECCALMYQHIRGSR